MTFKSDSASKCEAGPSTSDNIRDATTLEAGLLADKKPRLRHHHESEDALLCFVLIKYFHLVCGFSSVFIYSTAIGHLTYNPGGYFVEWISTLMTVLVGHMICYSCCCSAGERIEKGRAEGRPVESEEAQKAWQRLLLAVLLQAVAMVTAVPSKHGMRQVSQNWTTSRHQLNYTSAHPLHNGSVEYVSATGR